MKTSGIKRLPSAKISGFTLTELIIVVSIILSLMAMIVVAMSVANASKSEVDSELKRLSMAIRIYAEAHGGVLPPSNFSLIDTKVVVTPTPSKDEEKSSATLFYFLTHVFKAIDAGDITNPNKPRDPTLVGLPALTKGPALNPNDIARSMWKDYSLHSQTFDLVDLTLGYKGKTTWFIDPWGNPYKYTVKPGGTGFILESAGPDGKFGTTPGDDDSKDNIKLEEGR
jgi:prepilin-type N-terminal cleavage/methylation domain-containing protein